MILDENWDYKNISGDFWNDLPLNEQMEYLEKYYPIGSVFHEIQPDPNRPESSVYFEEYYCEIIEYELYTTYYKGSKS